jgi:pyruvate dehydrogenase E2 component (dihydrolipoamide acetyltransferase)
MSEFKLPDLGEGLEEAEIVAWHVSPGDHVVADQPLLSVETAKAVVEIPSPRSGTIAKIHGAPGDVIKVGAVLVEFTEKPAADTGAIVGELKRAPGVKASPAVRARARERGIDLATVKGSGPDGAILMKDIEALSAAAPKAKPKGRKVLLRGVRRTMAQNMARAGAEIVPVTLTDDANVAHWPADIDVTIRLVRAVAAGCAAEPLLNAWYDAAKGEIAVHEVIDLGIAMDTPDGLFAPVLRDVTGRGDEDLRRRLDAMKRDVAARAIPPGELIGQTITLSNFGSLGGRYAALVVMPPQVAILGAGRIANRVVPVGGKPAVCPMLPLSLTFDHRVVTGGEAARFLAAVVAELERRD